MKLKRANKTPQKQTSGRVISQLLLLLPIALCSFQLGAATGSLYLDNSYWRYPNDVSADSRFRETTLTLTGQSHTTLTTSWSVNTEIEAKSYSWLSQPDADRGMDVSLQFQTLAASYRQPHGNNSFRAGWLFKSDDFGQWWADTLLGVEWTTYRDEQTAFNLLLGQSGLTPSTLDNGYPVNSWVIAESSQQLSLSSVTTRLAHQRDRDSSGYATWLGFDAEVAKAATDSDKVQLTWGGTLGALAGKNSEGKESGQLVEGRLQVYFHQYAFYPTLDLAVTYASGSTDRAFRQTSIHNNYSLYGDTLAPELSNVRVLAVKGEITPSPQTTINVSAYHYSLASTDAYLPVNSLALLRANNNSRNLGVAVGVSLSRTLSSDYWAWLSCETFAPGAAIDSSMSDRSTLCSLGLQGYFGGSADNGHSQSDRK